MQNVSSPPGKKIIGKGKDKIKDKVKEDDEEDNSINDVLSRLKNKKNMKAAEVSKASGE